MKLRPKIKYLAMDKNKDWWGYENLPNYRDKQWIITGGRIYSANILDLPTDVEPEGSLIDLTIVSTEIESAPAQPLQATATATATAAKPFTVAQLNAAREQLKGDILELLAAFETKTGTPVQRIEFATYEFPPTVGPASFMSEIKILL